AASASAARTAIVYLLPTYSIAPHPVGRLHQSNLGGRDSANRWPLVRLLAEENCGRSGRAEEEIHAVVAVLAQTKTEIRRTGEGARGQEYGAGESRAARALPGRARLHLSR